MRKLLHLFLFLFPFFFFGPVHVLIASTGAIKFAKLEGVPWGLQFFKKGLLVSLKSGKLFFFPHALDGKTEKFQISGLPPFSEYGQGGLMDIALDPDYPQKKLIYFTFIKNKKDLYTTVLGRAELDLERRSLSKFTELVVTNAWSETPHHFGSRITFGKGMLFWGVGDRGKRENGQNKENEAASILALNLALARSTLGETQRKVYSFGHRNPQGLFFDKRRGVLWEVEHGPRGGDEINIIKEGKNYGWPVQSFGQEYALPLAVGKKEVEGVEAPWKVYTPSIAPSSLIVYSGKLYKEWEGDLLIGALALTHLNHVSVQSTKGEEIVHKNKEQRYLENLGERIRDISEAPNGEIFISADSGAIYRLLGPRPMK